ncbi:3-hydroxyacyl-CoA dehydrogenase NAD-binding domain-containing protein [Occallatibacter savannae]|uniref:3-hydroxyacyl-CoA dehydrogenase NAD-binding domain-containing protein n=1 Tax=Occallatibacter savannae TaxID=1002691 RepID=UPI003B8381B1
MGSGIAHVFAKSGYPVTLCDVQQSFLDRALASIRTNLGREAAKGKLPESDIDPTLARITPVISMDSLATTDLVVEAAPERFDLKADVFRKLDSILPESSILATNTSSISITKLAALTRRPGQVIGMHFFNPVPVMSLVEVVRGMATSDATFTAARGLSVKLGKTAVEVNDAPGFVSNRVLMPLINEAAYAVMEGVATAESVDQVFKLGMAHPMGPLTLADFIGIDVCVDILRVLHEGFGNPKYYPCPLLVRMVDAGWLGRKSGRGFYTYNQS